MRANGNINLTKSYTVVFATYLAQYGSGFYNSGWHNHRASRVTSYRCTYDNVRNGLNMV